MEDQKKNNPKVAIFNYNKDCQIITGDNPIVVPPGTPVNVFQGQQKKKPESPKQPNEIREQIKLRVMAEITNKFDFEDSMFGRDINGKRYTNERLGMLFGKCFGLRGAHPTQRFMEVIEQLWGILIDYRVRTPKKGGEQYYRQTVLNIIGYFHQQGILEGMPLTIAKSVFPDSTTQENESIKKNVTRGIESTSFPEGTKEVLDFYINKLQNGEF